MDGHVYKNGGMNSGGTMYVEGNSQKTGHLSQDSSGQYENLVYADQDHENGIKGTVFCGEVPGSEIQEFYKGKNVLITGATGFVGKILLERMLMSCPGVETIYVIIRGKKGHTALSRLEKMFESPLFQHVDKRTLSKVCPVIGELGADSLGLSIEDYKMLTEKINIVIHCAANVRFDVSLTELMKDNVKGTCDLMELTKKMTKLVSFVYVSTLYSNYYKPDMLEEKVYKAGLDLDTALGLINISAQDKEMLEVLLPKVLETWLNSYSYSKCMCENVVAEKGKGLPVCIFRPAVVMPTSHEHPVPGFVDNMNGGIALTAGICSGVIKMLLARVHKHTTMLPADYCGNAIIACSWSTAKQRSDGEPTVYNYVSQERLGWVATQYAENIIKHIRKEPLDQTYGYPFCLIISNYTVFRILAIWFYFIPGAFGDLLSILMRKKPMFLKMYRKILKHSTIGRKVFNTPFRFQIRNTRRLRNSLCSIDDKLFQMNLDEYMLPPNVPVIIRGIKKFILKEDPTPSKEALRKLKIYQNTFYASVYLLIFVGISFFLYLIQKIVL